MKVLILFYFYTATAVHEAGALAPANVHGAVPGSLFTKVYLSFWIYTATAVHEAGALAPANAHGAVPWRTLFRTLFPILYRSHIISLFEQAVEVLYILVTNVSRYGLHRLIGLL